MEIKSDMRIDIPLKLEGYLSSMDEGDTVNIYILPHVASKERDENNNKLDSYNHTRDAAIVKGTSVIFIKIDHELGDPKYFTPGQLISIDRNKIGYTVAKSIGKEIHSITYKGTEFTYGQSILVTATVGTGKTTSITEVCAKFCELPNTYSRRCTFGERMEDRMYETYEVDETVNTDSSAPIGLQYTRLMEALALSMDAAHKGNNSLFAIDSLTRLVQSLTGLYSESHMISGGIAQEVQEMAASILRLGGKYGKGTLTVIGTCLFAYNNNSWKSIYDVLSAAADGEIKILRLSKGLAFDVKSRRPPEVSYPYIEIFGEKIYY